MPWVRFEVKCETDIGDRVLLVGSDALTGVWNPAQSQVELQTTQTDYPWWIVGLDLWAGLHLYFKLVIVQSDGAVLWEEVPDRELLVQGGRQDTLRLRMKFNSQAVKRTEGKYRPGLTGFAELTSSDATGENPDEWTAPPVATMELQAMQAGQRAEMAMGQLVVEAEQRATLIEQRAEERARIAEQRAAEAESRILEAENRANEAERRAREAEDEIGVLELVVQSAKQSQARMAELATLLEACKESEKQVADLKDLVRLKEIAERNAQERALELQGLLNKKDSALQDAERRNEELEEYFRTNARGTAGKVVVWPDSRRSTGVSGASPASIATSGVSPASLATPVVRSTRVSPPRTAGPLTNLVTVSKPANSVQAPSTVKASPSVRIAPVTGGYQMVVRSRSPPIQSPRTIVPATAGISMTQGHYVRGRSTTWSSRV